MSPNYQKKTINYNYAINLSHIIDTDIPQWPGDPPVELDTVAEIESEGYYLRRLAIGEHSATHLNAPKSFYPSGIGVEQYPSESLILPAIVIDICKKAARNPDYCLTVADILTWEKEFGQIPPGNLVLLYTGWQDKWQNHREYFNQDESGTMHFPGFGYEATEFLIKERQIAGVGIDTHGIDSGQDTNFTINKLVLSEARIVLENLTNLDQIPPKNITIIIGVLGLRGGSGSPASVLALF